MTISMGGIPMEQIVDRMFEEFKFKFVVLKLPINYDVDSLDINKSNILFHKEKVLISYYKLI